MDFFDIGPTELPLIPVVALIVFGPGKVVEISRDAGKALRAFKKASSDLTAQVSKELEIEEKQHLMSCFNVSRTVSFGRKCDTSSQGRCDKTKPRGVTTWKEIKVDGRVQKRS